MQGKIEALVVRRTDLREYDRIITFYSRTRGKVQGIARGVRRGNSKRTALLEPFRILEVVLKKSKRGSLPGIGEAASLKEFPHICERLDCLSAAFHVLSILSRLTPSEEEDPHLYDLAVAVLESLDSHPVDPRRDLLLFQLHFLHIAGLTPEVSVCCECGREPGIGEKTPTIGRFSPDKGGILCSLCARGHPGMLTVPWTVVRWLGGAWEEQVPQGVDAVLDGFFRYQFGHRYRPPIDFGAGPKEAAGMPARSVKC